MTNKKQDFPELAISVRNLSKSYGSGKSLGAHLFGRLASVPYRLVGKAAPEPSNFNALRDISFDLPKGRSLGVIGLNGSGKSTLLQIIAGTLTPTSGEVKKHGRVAAILELGSGFNHEFTGRENARLNASVLGLKHEEIDHCMNDILAFADIGDFIDQPVRTYSSGMVIRLAFAVVAHVVPDVLLVDEALSVGDFLFQLKCLRAMKSLREKGCSFLFVSHSMEMVLETCKDALLLEKGSPVFLGPAKDAVRLYEKQNLRKSSQEPAQSPPEKLTDQEQKKKDTPFPELDIVTNKATILDHKITNQEGAPVSQIRSGEPMLIEFSVLFNGDFEDPHFGIRIRDNLGRIVYGTNSYSLGYPSSKVKNGETRLITFQLNQHLRSGAYAITIGCADGGTGFPQAIWKRVLFLRNDLLTIEILRAENEGDWEGSVSMKTIFEYQHS